MSSYIKKSALGLVIFSCSLAAMDDSARIITKGTEAQILELLNNGYDCNSVIFYKGTPIPLACLAAERGQVEVLKHLQSHNIDLSKVISDGLMLGYAPIHIAVIHGQLDVIRYLQSQRADALYMAITAGKNQGWTPMYLAASHGRVEVIKYLQSQGVPIDTILPSLGCAPIHIAAVNGQAEAVRYLQSQNVNITMVVAKGPMQGCTPMHLAASVGCVAAVEYLQPYVDFHAVIKEGLSEGCAPIHIAAAKGHVAVYRVFAIAWCTY